MTRNFPRLHMKQNALVNTSRFPVLSKEGEASTYDPGDSFYDPSCPVHDHFDTNDIMLKENCMSCHGDLNWNEEGKEITDFSGFEINGGLILTPMDQEILEN